MQNLTTIKLYNDSITPSPITGGELDLDANTIVPLSFAIGDIRDISKRKGTFSKSIVIPGTKNNNRLLNNYFDANVLAGTFDVNKLQKCSIIQNGITILSNAIIQLISINKSESNGSTFDEVTYTLLVKDTTSDFFTIINNKYLNDINFSELDHLYNATNVISSFDNTVADGFKYVMPFNSPDTDDNLFNLVEFTPAIYAKKYMDKIFAGAGYSYSWPTMNDLDIRFSNLLIPYNGEIPRTDKAESPFYTASANRTIPVPITAYKDSIQMTMFDDPQESITRGNFPYTLIVANNETFDPNNNYNTSTGIYTTPNVPSTTNSIKTRYAVEYEVKVVNSGGNKYFLGHYNPLYPGIPPLSTYYTMNGKKAEILPNITIKDNTIPFESHSLSEASRIFIPHGTMFGTGTTVLGTSTRTFETVIPGLVPGRSITVNGDIDHKSYDGSGIPFTDGGGESNHCWNFYNSTTEVLTFQGVPVVPATGIDLVYTVKSIYVTFVSELDGEYGYNVQLNMNKFVPQKIKQSDFVKSIFTMFNLFVDVDPSISTKLNIYKRNKYYDDGKVEDWTKKLDKVSPQEIKFIPEITNKKQIFTYKADEDWANKRYKESTNEIYGQAEFVFDNEYVKETTINELIFSPTPVANTPFGAICPIWNGQAPQTNIRILYDGGQLPCGQYTIQNYPGNAIVGNFYPCITHWDKPTNPTYDLNWLPCDYYFRSDNYGNNTNNNLFNMHWRRTMQQINNGKIMIAYFNLNEYDIQTMKLSDKIRIDNTWWNINSIKDYDANSNKPTKVELISIDENLQIPFTTTTSTPLSKGNPLLSVLNDLAKSKIPYVNTILSNGDIDIIGRGNLVTSDVSAANIFGNNNVVTANSTINGSNNQVNSPAIINGDNNQVDPGLEGVVIIGSGLAGSNGLTLYTNNIYIPSGGSINGQEITTITTAALNASLWESETGYIRTVPDKFRVYDAGELYLQPINIASVVSPIAGMMLFDSADNALKVYNGSAWVSTGGGGGTSLWSPGTGTDSIKTTAGTAVASGIRSLALGNGAVATGVESVAFAGNAGGVSSFANGGEANGNLSNSLGEGSLAETFSETVVGCYSSFITGNTTAINAADPAFRVGNGISGTPSDAFRVYKNGASYFKPITISAVTAPIRGMVAFDNATNTMKVHNGSGWTAAVAPTSVNSISIDWTAPFIYNTPTFPGTGNITSTNTGANLGIIQKIYHNSGTAPTFPANWVLLSGTYTVSQLNIIYAEYSTSTRVEYWII